MNFKSRFKIYLAHPKGVYGFSNMPKMNYQHLAFFEDWVMDEFKESVPMSTYLVSFALVDVEGKRIIDEQKDVAIRIWALVHTDDINFAGRLAYAGYKFYSNYFASDYSLPKLDILTLPHVDGDNEKYGLLTLSESTVLYPNEYHKNEESDIARNICHVVSHQWLGSFVTMSSWSEYWFHEALSDYLEAPCVKKLLNDSPHINNLIEVTVMEKMIKGLFEIEKNPSLVSFYKEHYNSVTQAFTASLTSEKAFFLIRMLNFFLGDEAFHESLITYMKTFGLRNSSLEQVWEIFTVNGRKTKVLSDFTVKDVMDSWITTTTYPVISVERDNERNTLLVKQESFTAYMTDEQIKSVSSNDCPIIPVNVLRKKHLVEGKKGLFSFWLRCQTVELLIDNDVDQEEWFLFNSHMNVLSRTNYDTNTWYLLQKSLLDENTFSIIDPLTRAHLISDIFEFCRAGYKEITYDFALETIQYLKHENKHCVWIVALKQLGLIYNNFLGTKLFKPFKKYVRQILTFVFDKEYSKIDELPEISPEKSLKRIIIEFSCLFGVKGCKKESKLLFESWYAKSIRDEKQNFSEIPLAIRDVVLCKGIRQSNQKYWDQLYKEYKKYKQDMRHLILKALACSKKEETLKTFLGMSLNPKKIFKKDSIVVFQSLSENKIGYPLQEEFLRSRYPDIEKYHNDAGVLASYIETLILSTSKREDLNKLKTYINDIRSSLGKYEYLVDDYYDETNKNIAWYERNEDTFAKFLDKFTSKRKASGKKSPPFGGSLRGLIFSTDKQGPGKDKNV